MAESKDDGGYWLPAHFLTDDDFLTGGENLKDSANASVGRNGTIPKGYFDPFRYSSSLNSPVESVVSSTETDSDQDEFVTELTRQLAESSLHDTRKLNNGSAHGTHAFCINRDPYEKSRLLGSSPQSTLNGFGGWSERSHCNGLPSAKSPTTPLGVSQDAWELIYAAAGQVARLKMNAQLQQRGLLGPLQNRTCQAPKSHSIGGFVSNPSLYPEFSQYNQAKQGKQPGRPVWGVGQGKEQGWYCPPMQTRGINGGCLGIDSGRCGGALSQSAWPSMRNQQPQAGCSDMRAVVLGGSAPVAKKKSTGTGVFLPRRPTETIRKKSGCCPTVLLPARVVQALNLDLEEMNHAPPQPCFANGYIPDHDILMARRNAIIMAQQKQRMLRSEGAAMMMAAHESRLPQDWTY